MRYCEWIRTDAGEMLAKVNSHWFVLGFELLISWATVRLVYLEALNRGEQHSAASCGLAIRLLYRRHNE